MKSIITWCLIGLGLLFAACSNETTPTGSVTEQATYIGVTPPSDNPRLPQVDNRYGLASRYLSGPDLLIAQAVLEQWDLHNRSAVVHPPDGSLRPYTGEPWQASCLLLAMPGAQGECADMLGAMQGVVYHSSRYVCDPCGPTPSPGNYVFTPEFVEDVRGALDPLFHRDARGGETKKVTLVDIFQRARQLPTEFPQTYGKVGAAGLWAAAMVIGYDLGGFDSHDNGCQGGACTEGENPARFGIFATGMAVGTWAFIAAPILAAGPPSWVVGTLAYGGYFVGVAAYEVGERIYYRYCDDASGEFESEDEFLDSFQGPPINELDPLNYNGFMLDPDWRLP